MQINNYSPSFGAKFRTINILEATTLKNIESETISDLKPIIDGLWPKKLKGAGNRGYRFYLKEIGNNIINKYPKISDATLEILEFARFNPKATKHDYKEFVKPFINEIGEVIDITL